MGKRFLDVGCGDDVPTAEIKTRWRRIVGVELSPDMIAAAVKGVSETSYVVVDSIARRPRSWRKLRERERARERDPQYSGIREAALSAQRKALPHSLLLRSPFPLVLEG